MSAHRHWHLRRSQGIAEVIGATAAAAIALALLNTGCRNAGPLGSGTKGSGSAEPAAAATPTEQQQRKQQQQQRIGHAATVRCLRGERGTTDGDELRCEDWRYVISNYGMANSNGSAGR